MRKVRLGVDQKNLPAQTDGLEVVNWAGGIIRYDLSPFKHLPLELSHENPLSRQAWQIKLEISQPG
jgi:hypothetical protein